MAELPSGSDVVVVGAGIVGTAVAARLSAAGCEVCVLDRASPGAGSSSSGEGNVLLSDKLPGPDLAIARRGVALWRELAAAVGPTGPGAGGSGRPGADLAGARSTGAEFEFDPKGGLVVALDDEQFARLQALAAAQREAGAIAEVLDPAELRSIEPNLAPGLAGGVWYPEDCQVQPMLVVAHQVAVTRARGGRVAGDTEALGCRLDGDGRIIALRTSGGEITVGTAVVNAAGPWSGVLAERLGSSLPVVPRRGHVLVTEPVAGVTGHKVYEAGYVGSIHADDRAGFTCSSVVESTASGTMLLGSSREFAGWSRATDPAVVAAIAARAVALFPMLARVRLMRTYLGFRPATPDRLPVIGWDGSVGALVHATGHEGAGVGLCQVTAEAVECLLLGQKPPLDLAPFDPARFAGHPAASAHADGAAR
jgi:glycine/D-amino acid oxidase-like deaminating enzyme